MQRDAAPRRPRTLGLPALAALYAPAAALLSAAGAPQIAAGAPALAAATPFATGLSFSTAAATRDLPPWTNGDVIYALTSEYDYSAGGDALMDIYPPWPTVQNLHTWVGDTEAVCAHGLIYVVSRWGADHVTVLDPFNQYAVVRQFSVGAGSNPQQICLADRYRGFVTRYESDELWEVDPSTGQHTDTIDLGPLADADGIPEMHKMAIHAGRLYVTIQRIDRTLWEPAGGSCLAVIDLADNSLIDMNPAAPGVQGIDLAAENPNSGILIDPRTGDFLIGELGFYGLNDGGIERLDPDTHESRGFALTEAALGGDLHTWTTGNGRDGYAVRMTAGWTTEIAACDLVSGQVGATIAASGEFAYAHMLVDLVRDELVVCDRAYADPGLRIFDLGTLQLLTPQPIGVGLYPHWLVAVPGPDSGVVARSSASAGRILASPQPARERVTLTVAGTGRPAAGIDIFAPDGRRVARLEDASIWDGRDAAGRRLPPGVYLARTRADGAPASGTIHLVR